MPTMTRRVTLTGWGRTEPTAAEFAEPQSPDDVAGLVKGVAHGGVIARGLGRSYNNAAQNDGGLVISTSGMRDVLSFDPQSGVVTCEAGVSLEQLMTDLLPSGWFVPVSPGTRKVTVGGAIAADVHGKNHHSSGSFARHVLSFELLTADGAARMVTPESDPDLFWATAGGMGLTGIILRATISMKKVDTSRLIVDTVRTANIDDAMAHLTATDKDYEYTVAWTDCLATRGSLGRSIITSGDFAKVDDLRNRARGKPLAFRPSALAGAPAVFPSGLMNARTVSLLNEAYFRKAPRHRSGEIQAIGKFFHPLDAITNWNRVYGPAGFRQYQYVVPFAASDVVLRSLERISALQAPSFVTVVKRFGAGDPGMLSFPIPGWTLALDFPARTPWLSQLCAELDEMVLEAGGRLYLAKDSRIPAGLMPKMYPRLEDFRRVRAQVDPAGLFSSDLSRRLEL
ncbi:MAG: FAD-binding oxidoreductase [Nocardiopsaceae bacterium]|jgi:decaprenylphospho-beta-D-ribofuranose 2-oxidase|nr:FAD-binding oxidoreductase [Nocardiopsaceae bacterium]